MTTPGDWDDWDAACAILGDLDYEAQYVAIRGLLRRQRDVDAALEKELAELVEFAKRTSGSRNEQAVEEYGVGFYTSVFQDAAHSMAAAGMLAPFVESLFTQAFRGIREQRGLRGIRDEGHPRWSMDAEQRWDCHCVVNSPKSDIARGIIQLSEASGLITYLPTDLKLTLEALFGYRNKMFHGGFEWQPEIREKFAARIANDKWPSNWFDKACSGGQPWIFYLTDAFVDHCLEMIEAVLRGFGAFTKALIVSAPLVKSDAPQWVRDRLKE